MMSQDISAVRIKCHTPPPPARRKWVEPEQCVFPTGSRPPTDPSAPVIPPRSPLLKGRTEDQAPSSLVTSDNLLTVPPPIKWKYQNVTPKEEQNRSGDCSSASNKIFQFLPLIKEELLSKLPLSSIPSETPATEDMPPEDHVVTHATSTKNTKPTPLPKPRSIDSSVLVKRPPEPPPKPKNLFAELMAENGTDEPTDNDDASYSTCQISSYDDVSEGSESTCSSSKSHNTTTTVKATTTVRVITPPPLTSRASPPVPKLTGCHSPLFQRRMLNESNRDGKQKETTVCPPVIKPRCLPENSSDEIKPMAPNINTTVVVKAALSTRISAPMDPPPPPPLGHSIPTGCAKYLSETKYVRKGTLCPESLPTKKAASHKMDEIQKEIGKTVTKIKNVKKQLEAMEKETYTEKDSASNKQKRHRRLLRQELKLDERRSQLTREQKNELIGVLNLTLIEIATLRQEEGLPIQKSGNDALPQLLRLELQARDIFMSHLTTSALLRELTHEQDLKCYDITEHFDNVLQECKILGSSMAKKVRQFLVNVFDEIAALPEFAFKLIDIGSHHDGTKLYKHDEMDFVLLSKYTCDVDYEVLPSLETLEYCIMPKRDVTDLLKYCDDSGILVVSKYKASFRRTLCSALHLRSRLHHGPHAIDFGGFDKPFFSGIRCNGPALTVCICGISVDLTIAFQSPDRIMRDILTNAHPMLTNLVMTNIQDYSSKGILVPYAGVAWKISTSWMETCLLRGLKEDHIIKSTLKICKHYNECHFLLKWPCMKQVFKHQIQTLRNELHTVIPQYKQKTTDLFKTYNPHNNSGIEMLIYNAIDDTLCIQEQDTDYVDIDNEENAVTTLKAVCKHRMMDFLADSSKTSLNPSLAELNNEQITPLAGTVSAIFKFITLKEFTNYNPSLNRCVDPEFVLKVLTSYSDLIQKDSWVQHPFLGDKIQIRKTRCHTDHVYMPSLDVGQILNSHSIHVANIVATLQQCLDEIQ